MDLITVGSIIIGTFAALFLGMAALLKTMVVGKLERLQSAVDEQGKDHHKLDLRVTKLEERQRFDQRAKGTA